MGDDHAQAHLPQDRQGRLRVHPRRCGQRRQRTGVRSHEARGLAERGARTQDRAVRSAVHSVHVHGWPVRDRVPGHGRNVWPPAFHDVAWKNIKDAGFPDRILWHQAVAAKYPYYDITRVGPYGTSAGGQNSLGGLLFFPEFYKVAASASGCHDNRMDKIWWNEQWMGWPIGSQYAESSNVDNAYRLQGKVLLIVGEMDQNVDPASTYQVVNQLIKHNKDFDLVVIPGAGHTSGGPYGDHKRYDFFTRHFLNVTPPEWKTLEDLLKKKQSSTTTSSP